MKGLRNLSKIRGFSLVEVLIAMLILAIGTLAITSSMVTIKGLQTESREIEEAGEVANCILESFRKMPYLVLHEGIPSGNYRIWDISSVYDAEENVYQLIDSNLMYRLESQLDNYRLYERITVEQETDALRVSVSIRRDEDASLVVSSATFITENGLNFRS